MKELVKVIAELVNAQLGIVNIKTKTESIYNICWINVDLTYIAINTIDDKTCLIEIDDISSIEYITIQ